MQKKIEQTRYIFDSFGFIIIAALLLSACQSSTSNAGYAAPPPEALPVITVSSMAATTFQEFSASLEGSKDIQVRPQIEGYIEKIFVDEGGFIKFYLLSSDIHALNVFLSFLSGSSHFTH